jgi:hypothetical protein
MDAGRNKQGLVDAWTPVHLLFGAMTRYVGLSPWAALGVWIAFEVLENTLANLDAVKAEVPSSGPETAANIVGDVIANAAGYAALSWWLEKQQATATR